MPFRPFIVVCKYATLTWIRTTHIADAIYVFLDFPTIDIDVLASLCYCTAELRTDKLQLLLINVLIEFYKVV